MIDAEAKLKFGTAAFEQAALAAFGELNKVLARKFQLSITRRIWSWPNETRVYRSGKVHVEGSPRDIVDTGNLRDSYDFLPPVSPRHYRHVWDAEHAAAVHNGAVIMNGFGKGIVIVLPARPWVRVTLREFDVQKGYNALLKIELGKIKDVGKP